MILTKFSSFYPTLEVRKLPEEDIGSNRLVYGVTQLVSS